ncbi:MAB_1171c family putative transporter [Streptomyces sp. NPDC018055]|uniref:MAB_1171c family putative transporter n=1 Tax=Streptomyces sp. NPDC018055 TaxID=3365038 RepID=UPI0037A445D6
MSSTSPDLYAWAVVAPLTAAVIWRTPAAIRSPQSRTLWLVFAALDVSMITRISSVGDFLYDVTGIDDAATLTKHLVGIIAVAGLLRWVTSVVPGRDEGQREPTYRRVISNRPRRIVTWGAIIVITAIFPLSYRRVGPQAEDADFIYQQAGHFWGSLHLILFYAYLIFGMICASMMCSAAARDPRAHGPFKVSMQGLALGCAVGSVYGILRSAFLIARLADKPFLGGPSFVDVGSNLALIGCIALVLMGSTVPAWERMDARMEAHAAVNDLRPMWVRLTQAAPEVVYGQPQPTPTPMSRFARRAPRLHSRGREFLASLADFWNWRNLDYRLRRRITEICDAALQLQPYVAPSLREEAESTAKELGLPEHAVSAYLLRTAIHRRRAGDAPYDVPPEAESAILKHGDDLQAATRELLPIGKAMENRVAMSSLDRRLANV